MTTGTTVRARFDDVLAGTSCVFSDVRQEVVAVRPDEVATVLDEVERTTGAGAWAVGFVAYEAAAGLDPALHVLPHVEGLPLAWFGICSPPVPAALPCASAQSWDWSPACNCEQYEKAVERVRERIAAGDTYQCNLTTRFTAPLAEDPSALYGSLVRAQRSAHNAYLDTGRFAIASASPELFFELRGDVIRMRPMKGTAARGRNLAEDGEAVARLCSSEKERAENVMIVDLVRNDLARIAATGSVRVTALCRHERYETVHQLTSDVEARLRPGTRLLDIFRALFPCGSVTGAPKASTMRIVTELEDTPRGVYCGAVGVVAPPGQEVRARFNVAIRTVVADRARGTATYGTGGGVTWSSDPRAEHAEAISKTAVLHAQPPEFHLIETLRFEPRRGPLRLEEHLQRMADSAAYFGFAFRPGALRAALVNCLNEQPPDAAARIRMTAHRDGSVAVTVDALTATSAEPVRLALDQDAINSQECWPLHKTSRREPYDRRRSRHRADDVLLVNERGEITETCTANVALLLEGRWWTPPLSSGCLPGIGRAKLLAENTLRERTIHPEDLARAEAIALVSSLRGWRTATLISDSKLAPSTVAKDPRS